MVQHNRDVRFVPIADKVRCNKNFTRSPVGAQQTTVLHFDTDRLGGLEIDHELEFRRLPGAGCNSVEVHLVSPAAVAWIVTVPQAR